MPGEPATRDDLRELRTEFRQEIGPIKDDIGELKTGFALLVDWRKTVTDRNRAIPGWLFNGISIAIPTIGALLYIWAKANFPGFGGP